LSSPETPSILPRHRNGGDPIFESPWHAEVLAIADALAKEGLFTSGAWAKALGAALREARDRSEPDNASTYYDCALTALETLVAQCAPHVSIALSDRVEQWRRAYLNTPHGQPVELAAGVLDQLAVLLGEKEIEMRKVIASEWMSLDGVGNKSRPGGT
jgi:nitrile hydratase accessory protein